MYSLRNSKQNITSFRLCLFDTVFRNKVKCFCEVTRYILHRQLTVAQPTFYTDFSIPLSQNTATVLYPEPVKSNQRFRMNFNIILPFLLSYTTVHTVDFLLCLRVRQKFKHVRKQCSLKVSVLVTHQITLLSNSTLPVDSLHSNAEQQRAPS